MAGRRADGWTRSVRPAGSRASRRIEVGRRQAIAVGLRGHGQQAEVDQGPRRRQRLDPQARQRLRQPGQRPGRRLRQGEQAQRQPRPVPRPGEHGRERPGTLQVLGDLPGQQAAVLVPGLGEPERRLDRAEPVRRTAPGPPDRRPRGARRRSARRSAVVGVSSVLGSASAIIAITLSVRRGACVPSGATRRGAPLPPRHGPARPSRRAAPRPSAPGSCVPAAPRPGAARRSGSGRPACAA